MFLFKVILPKMLCPERFKDKDKRGHSYRRVQKKATLAARSERIFYNGYSIGNVSWFKNLGAKLMSRGSDQEEVFDRVEKAQGALDHVVRYGEIGVCRWNKKFGSIMYL